MNIPFAVGDKVYIDICCRIDLPAVILGVDDNEPLIYAGIVSNNGISFCIEDIPVSCVHLAQKAVHITQAHEESLIEDDIFPLVCEIGYFEDDDVLANSDPLINKVQQKMGLKAHPIVEYKDLVDQITADSIGPDEDMLIEDDPMEDFVAYDFANKKIDPLRFFRSVKRAQRLAVSAYQRNLLTEICTHAFMLLNDDEASCTSLLIAGPSGCGKTHICMDVLPNVLETCGIDDVKLEYLDASNFVPSSFRGGKDLYDVQKMLSSPPFPRLKIFVFDEFDSALLERDGEVNAAFKLQKQLLSITDSKNLTTGNKVFLVCLGAFAEFYTECRDMNRSVIGFSSVCDNVSSKHPELKDWLRKRGVLPELLSRFSYIVPTENDSVQPDELRQYAYKKLADARKKLHGLGINASTFDWDIDGIVAKTIEHRDAGSFRLIDRAINECMKTCINDFFMARVDKEENEIVR